jgi:3-methyladenine DNA glycosylase AlkD
MVTTKQMLAELKKKGSAQTRKTHINHGAPEDRLWGVKVGDMKPLAKKLKGEQEIALELYDSGISDAMYLAGMVADGAKMNKTQLNKWAKEASWYFISEYSVPGVATESPHAKELALKWIKAKKESVAACGWNTYSGIIATRDNDELDLKEVEDLLNQVVKDIGKAPNRVRYTMNAYVIGVGSYIPKLLKKAKAAAKKIGKVDVDVGGTSCKVPLATDYIAKIEKMGRVGKKRKTIKC